MHLSGVLNKPLVQKIIAATVSFRYPVTLQNEQYGTQKDLLVPLLQQLVIVNQANVIFSNTPPG